MAPPKERAKPPAADDISTTADIDKKATWNSATAKLPAFITALRRNDSMFGLVHHSYSLVRRGWFADSKGKKMVESYRHMVWIIDNPDKLYTFESPSPVGPLTSARPGRMLRHSITAAP